MDYGPNFKVTITKAEANGQNMVTPVGEGTKLCLANQKLSYRGFREIQREPIISPSFSDCPAEI
ncbi:hypothetical protein E4U22_005707 [Claviceps purpurea]|nr:hypothetical protein E4U22_005707 [Claviceps purpurea]